MQTHHRAIVLGVVVTVRGCAYIATELDMTCHVVHNFRYEGSEGENASTGFCDESHVNALKELQTTAQEQDAKVAALLLKRQHNAEMERKWGNRASACDPNPVSSDDKGDGEEDDSLWLSDDNDEHSAPQCTPASDPAQVLSPHLVAVHWCTHSYSHALFLALTSGRVCRQQLRAISPSSWRCWVVRCKLIARSLTSFAPWTITT